jgi:hypothetical protein
MTAAAGLIGARSERRVEHVSRHNTATRSADLPESPWARKHRIRLGVLATLGTVAATFCWYGGSGTGKQDEQVWWLVGSVLSLLVILVSGVLWILQGIRAVKRAERDLVEFLRGGTPGAERAPASSQKSERRVTAPGMTRYHVESCPLVAGKPTTTHTGQRELSPCGVCLS